MKHSTVVRLTVAILSVIVLGLVIANRSEGCGTRPGQGLYCDARPCLNSATCAPSCYCAPTSPTRGVCVDRPK